MTSAEKDKEIRRLRVLLARRNATIRELKNPQNEESEEEQTSHVEGRILDIEDMPPDVKRIVNNVFGETIDCSTCRKKNVTSFVFCTACNIGWAYCKKCGGFSKAKKQHKIHITPTHGVFLDMYDKYDTKNSYNKPN